MADKRFNYLPGLDSIRAFAAMMVLFLHGSYGFFTGGWIGVDLFFALSGFLITSLLLFEFKATRDISIKKFYIRRILRLAPPLIITLILANLLWSFSGLPDTRFQATLAGLFYFTNLIHGQTSGNLAHLWSLSVEEHFYIFWPVFVLFLIFRTNIKNRILIITFLILAVSIFKIYVFNQPNHDIKAGFFTINALWFTFCRIDGILMGSLLAILLPQQNIKLSRSWPLYLCIAAFVVFLFNVDVYNKIWNSGGFLVTDLLCIVLILFAVKHKHILFSNKILTWIGKRSYGIYVYHFPIFVAMEVFKKHHNLPNFILVTGLRFGLTFLLAAISYRFIEQPILKLKKNFEFKRRHETIVHDFVSVS